MFFLWASIFHTLMMGRVSAPEQVFPSSRFLLIHFEDFSKQKNVPCWECHISMFLERKEPQTKFLTILKQAWAGTDP